MTTTNNTSVNTEEEYQEVEADFDAMERKASGRQFNNFTLKDGANVYRILPPFGSATKPGPNKGFIVAEYYIHWGFKDAQGKVRPLQCLKKKKSDVCPICEFADALEKRYNDLVAAYVKGEGKDRKVDWAAVPEDVKAKHKKLYDAWDNIKWRRNYYFNALSQDGKVGVLKVSKTAGDDLISVMSECVKKNFNPASLKKGCYMNLQKRKTGNRTTDVEVKSQPLRVTKTDADGNPVEKIELSELQPEIMKSAVDLFTLYERKTADEMKRLLKGDTTIFDRKDRDEAPASAASAPESPAPVATTETVTKPVETAPAPKSEPATQPAATPAVDDVEAVLNAQQSKSAEQSMDALLADIGLDEA